MTTTGIDKNLMKDEKGRYITQGLFLELNYNSPFATFTLDGQDKDYKGKVYPSLKRLFLEAEDVTEYLFATKYLVDWKHWQRICDNKVLAAHVEEWREELTLMMRAAGLRSMLELTSDDKSFQAAKWLAEEGWTEKKRGRPSKAEKAAQAAKDARLAEEINPDILAFNNYKKDK